MTEMNDMQKRVDQYIRQFKSGYFSPLGQLARLSEEVGELAREVNHRYGEKQKKASEEEKKVEEEIGDVLFVLISLANSLDIDLSESFDLVMDKFHDRDQFRFERHDGRERETERKS